MAAPIAKKKTPWAGKKASETALFSPRAEKSWCSVQTAFWVLDRTNIDIGVPGVRTKVGDIPGGKTVAGSWNGLVMYQDETLNTGVIVAQREGRTYHVRLENGEVHEGRPDQCDDGVCLAEKVMGE